MIQQNPRLAESALGSDPRMIDVLGALMGIDMQGFSRDEGSEDLPSGFSQASPSAASSSAPPPASKPTPKPEPTPAPAHIEEDEEMDEDAANEKKAKADAEKEKALGAAAYKARDLAAAEAHFSKAWDLWPKDITFLSNLGAVYFERGAYQEAIDTCEKAVEAGRELRADYKLVAKALGRIGSSYAKLDKMAEAVRYYQKSLSEHRTPDILNKLREVERAKAEADKQAYIDPVKATEAREEGNKLFKSGDFAGAVKLYTECVKRDPADPRGWTNRAAAYQKLVALPEALKDAEKAIQVDPKYGTYFNVWLVASKADAHFSQGVHPEVARPRRHARAL
jgi:stress-induced-phosphoprotein 1